MTGYELHRRWFNFAFDNKEAKVQHTALFTWVVELNNRLGWKQEFGLPTTDTMEGLSIGNKATYLNALKDLQKWGFIEIIKEAKNQYQSCIIKICRYESEPALIPALDTALIQHEQQHCNSIDTSIGVSIVPIDKQSTIKPKTNKTINNKEFVPSGTHQKFIKLYCDFFLSKTGINPKINGQDGKAVKELIPYLTNQSLEKNELGAEKSFKFILDNWSKVEPFLQSQMKLSQINSNINNIINQLKNGKHTKPTIQDKLNAKFTK